MSVAPGCPLCEGPGGVEVHESARLRVIRADEPGFPAFYRVVWAAHAAEFTDLGDEEQAHCMRAVACVERVLREVLAPAKINLAALGNQVPHLHWHVIARFEDDSHFPAPVWAPARREPSAARVAAIDAQRERLEAAMREALIARGF